MKLESDIRIQKERNKNAKENKIIKNKNLIENKRQHLEEMNQNKKSRLTLKNKNDINNLEKEFKNNYEKYVEQYKNDYLKNKGITKKQFDKLPKVKYNKEKYSENYQCIICMEEFEKNEKVTLLPCDHIFHSNCIEQWLLKQRSCPFCKSEIR